MAKRETKKDGILIDTLNIFQSINAPVANEVAPDSDKNLIIDKETELEETEESKQTDLYKPFYQGKHTNIFTEITTKKSKHTVKEDSNLWLFPLGELDQQNNILTLQNPNNSNLSVSSSKLYDYIVIQMTEYLTYKGKSNNLSNCLTAELSVKDYMKKRGITKKDKAVAQLKKDAEALFNARMTVTEEYYTGSGKKRKQETHRSDIRILDKIPNKDDKIRDVFSVHIALSLAEYLTTHQMMYYPLKLLLTTDNNNVYYLGKWLVEFYNMNQLKTNKDSVKVSSLLEHTPDIPTLEAEKNKSRRYRDKCINPLEKTLDRLFDIGILKEWHFTNAKKHLIPQEKLDAMKLTYEDFNNMYVHFVLADYPDTYKKKVLEDKKKKELEKA